MKAAYISCWSLIPPTCFLASLSRALTDNHSAIQSQAWSDGSQGTFPSLLPHPPPPGSLFLLGSQFSKISKLGIKYMFISSWFSLLILEIKITESNVCSLILSSAVPKVNFGMSLLSCFLFLHLAPSKQDSSCGGPHIQLRCREIVTALRIRRVTLNMLLEYHSPFKTGPSSKSREWVIDWQW